MAKSIKHCSTCEENFADRFSFCPVCGTTLETAEVGSKIAVAAAPPAIEAPASQQREEKHHAAAIPVVTAAASETASFVKRESVGTNGSAALHHAEPVKVSPPVMKPEPVAEFKPAPQSENYQELNSAIISDSENMPPRNDGLYHLTILEAPSARRRDMSYGAFAGLVLLLTFLTGFWIWGLFQTNLDIEAVGAEEFLLSPVMAENAPEEIEEPKEVVRKDTDKGGGGGGGGQNDPKPPSQGKMPPMRPEPQLIAPSVDMHVNPKATLKQSASLEGPKQPVDTRNLPYGIETSKNYDPSNGLGGGRGIGTGSGSGIGGGSGTGYGNGRGSGIGNGDGNGIGDGTGDGTGAPPLPKPKPEPVAAVTEPLQILSKPQPKFTEEARKQNIKGIVRLKVTFSASGQVTGIAPVQGLGGGLTEQAIAAARMIRFTPMKKNGQAVSVSKTVEYNFNMY